MKADELQKAMNWATVGVAAYFIGSAIAGAIKRHKESTDGIGAVRTKRRIWQEVEAAQRAGIDLTDKSAWEKHAPLLRQMASGKIREDGKLPIEQRYFNQLSRSYKSIAGTNLPCDQSVVRNEYGDVILIYNDYHLDQLPKKASEWLYSENENQPGGGLYSAYNLTIAAIALGRLKFVWKSSKDKVHRGVETLVFGMAAPLERKQRISYLASPEKGGIYPERWVHTIWEMWNGERDDSEIANGVYQAIRDCPSVGWARQYCIEDYLKAHEAQEPLLYQDVPF